MRIRAVAVLLVLVFFSIQASAQLILFELSGSILNRSNNEPIVGALIETHESNAATYSDSTGSFILVGLSAGIHHVHVEMTGFKAYADYVSVSENRDNSIVFYLEESDIELKQVVIESEVSKADYIQHSLDLMVLSKDDLQSSGAMTISQKLTRLPGVNQLQTGVGISKPVIRGMSGTRILVSDLGLKQEGQQWGSDHGLELDPFGAEKIEVIKGPATLLYGSDALGGVIRIQTPSIPDEGLSGENSTLFRSNNNYLGNSLAINGKKGKWFGKARGTWAEYGDYKVPATSFTYLNRTLPIENERLKNTSGRDFHYQITGGYAGERGVTKLTWSHFHQRNGLFPGIVGIPTGSNVADDGDSRNVDLPQQNVDHYKLAINSSINLSKGWLQFDAGVQRNERQELIRPHREGYAPLPSSSVAHSLALNTAQAYLRWHSHNIGSWRFIPGVSTSFQTNSRAGWEFLLPSYTSFNGAAFLFSEYNDESRKMIWNAGIRGDYGNLQSDAFSIAQYNSDEVIVGYSQRAASVNKKFYNFSGGAGWSWVPRDGWNLKGNAARSFRIPNPAELLINGIHHGTFRHEMGNSSLKNETGYQLDLTLLYERKNIYLKFTPFFNYFQNYIYLSPTANFSTLPDGGQVYQYSQNDATFAGAEVYMEWHPISKLHVEFGLDGVKTYNLNTGLALPFSPPLRTRLSSVYETECSFGLLKGYEFGFTYLGWSDQKDLDRNEEKTNGAYTFDCFVKSKWSIGRQDFFLMISSNNILDRYYLNHLSAYRQLNLPEQGRNFAISLSMPFNIKKLKH